MRDNIPIADHLRALQERPDASPEQVRQMIENWAVQHDSLAANRLLHALAAQVRGRRKGPVLNDAFVMKAWGQAQNAIGTVDMMADGNGDFTRALGLELDAKGFGMGERSKRFAAVLEGGVVKQLFVEAPGAFEVSSADYMLSKL